MKILLLFIVLFSLLPLIVFPEDEEEKEPEPRDLYSASYLELGLNVGTPAGINAALGYWFGAFGLRVSGMYWGALSGIQGNLGLKLADNIHLRHVLALVGGTMRMERQYSIVIQYDGSSTPEFTEKLSWTYLGLVYNLNAGGFFLEVGGSGGWGDFPSPQLLIQIGYMHRFIPKQ